MAEEETQRASLRTQWSQLSRLRTFVRPYRLRLFVGTAAVVVAAGLGLVFPAVIGSLVDTALGSLRCFLHHLARIGALLFPRGHRLQDTPFPFRS